MPESALTFRRAPSSAARTAAASARPRPPARTRRRTPSGAHDLGPYCHERAHRLGGVARGRGELHRVAARVGREQVEPGGGDLVCRGARPRPRIWTCPALCTWTRTVAARPLGTRWLRGPVVLKSTELSESAARSSANAPGTASESAGADDVSPSPELESEATTAARARTIAKRSRARRTCTQSIVEAVEHGGRPFHLSRIEMDLPMTAASRDEVRPSDPVRFRRSRRVERGCVRDSGHSGGQAPGLARAAVHLARVAGHHPAGLQALGS